MSSEPPLDRFYSSADPENFRSEVRELVRRRLEAELLQSRIEPLSNGAPHLLRRRGLPISPVISLLSLLLALGGFAIFLFISGQQSERLRLAASELHSTEGKLIEVLAVKAGNDRGYVERLLEQYRVRLEERRRVEAERAGVVVDLQTLSVSKTAAVVAEQRLQGLLDQRVTAAEDKAVTALSSTDPGAAVQQMHELQASVAEGPLAPFVNALSRAFSAAAASARRAKEAEEKAAAASRALAAREAAPAEREAGSETQLTRQAPRPATQEELEQLRQQNAAAVALLLDSVRRLSAFEAWDSEAAASEVARVTSEAPGLAELSRAIVALADHAARGRTEGGALKFFGTVSTVLGDRILADVAGAEAVVGTRVRIYRSGGQGARGKELAQATITEIRGHSASLRITTPRAAGSPPDLGIAPLDTIYISE